MGSCPFLAPLVCRRPHKIAILFDIYVTRQCSRAALHDVEFTDGGLGAEAVQPKWSDVGQQLAHNGGMLEALAAETVREIELGTDDGKC